MKTLLLALLLSASWIGIAPAADEAPSSLLHWFPFDEGQGDKVTDSKGGVSGKIRFLGDRVKWVPGKSGTGLEFTAPPPESRGTNGCVEVKVPSAQFSEGVTVEAWICPSASGVDSVCGEIISNTYTDNGTGFRLRLRRKHLDFISGPGGYGTASTYGAPVWGPAMVQNTWYHVAGTWDKSVFRIYVNGKLVVASKENLLLTPGRDTIFIGAYNGGYAYGYDGIIDEVKIYTAALTPEEILKAATKQ